MFTGLNPLIFRYKRHLFSSGLLALLFFAVISILFSVEFQNPLLNFSIGEASPKSIYASRDIIFQSEEDLKQTKLKRAQVKATHQDIYRIDRNQNTTIRSNFIRLFLDIDAAKIDPDYQTPFMSQYRRTILLKSSDDSLKRLEFLGLQQLDILLSSGIKRIDKEALNTQIKNNLSFSPLSSFEQKTLRYFILEIIKPNMFFDEATTQEQLQVKLDTMQTINTRITKGDLLVTEGEIITPTTYERLEIFQKKTRQFNILYFIGLIFMTSLLFALSFFKIRNALSKNQRLFDVELLFFYSHTLYYGNS